MAGWLKRIAVYKGNVALIDDPGVKQCFILFKAPQDAIVYLFKDMESVQRWIEKKNRALPSADQVPVGLDMPLEFMLQQPGASPEQIMEKAKLRQTQEDRLKMLEEERKKRLAKKMKELEEQK